MVRVGFYLVLVWILAALPAPARDVALVIGNAEYTSENKLENPVNDARRMAWVLEGLGYDVTSAFDQSLKSLDKTLTAFEAKATGASRVVVFYSGHGIEVDGKNYLVPVDAELRRPGQQLRQAMSLDEVLHVAGLGDGLSVVILDACRSNNFSWGKGLGRIAPISGGASQVAKGQIVAYSTQPHAPAWDSGRSGALSPYTRALIERLEKDPTEDLRILFSSLAEATTSHAGRPQYPDYKPGQFQPGVSVQLASALKPPAPLPERYPDLSVFRDCSSCPELVVVPGGSFVMGSPEGEDGRRKDEGPQHRVDIEQFALARTEVTVGSYRRFLDESGYTPASRCWVWDTKEGKWNEEKNRGWSSPGFSQTDDHPVSCISWRDAQEYIGWLNGKVSGSDPYRLPSESEWEYAARGGTTTPFAFGETISTDQANYNGNFVYGFGRKGPYRMKTVAVEDLAASNDWGLRHMHGNVWEWTDDCWHESYDGAPTDGSAWLSSQGGNCSSRVVRGGSWGSGVPQLLRSATAAGTDPSSGTAT